jgi:hypothetical protein
MNYIQKATAAFQLINSLLNNRFEIINPVLLKLFNIEKKLYQTFLESFGAHSDLKERLQNMKEKYCYRQQVIYDPIKYIKGTNTNGKQFYRKKSLSSTNLINDIKSNPKDSKLSKIAVKLERPPSKIIPEEDEFSKLSNIYSTNVNN